MHWRQKGERSELARTTEWNVNANKMQQQLAAATVKNMIKLKWCMRHDFNPNFVKCNEKQKKKNQQQQQQ